MQLIDLKKFKPEMLDPNYHHAFLLACYGMVGQCVCLCALVANFTELAVTGRAHGQRQEVLRVAFGARAGQTWLARHAV